MRFWVVVLTILLLLSASCGDEGATGKDNWKRSPGVKAYYQGAEYVEKKQYLQALERFNEAIRIDPNLAPAYHGRGYARNQIGELKEAVEDYSKALRLDPNYAKTHMYPGSDRRARAKHRLPRRAFLVLDLNGDGIGKVSLRNSTAMFDMEDTDFVHHTEWISPDDGFLALDADNNGAIDDRTEVFSDTGGLANGYEKLKSHDANGDNVINQRDAVFSDLKIWQDLNGNSVTDDGELKAVGDLNIQSISMDYGTDQTSTFTFSDGTTGQIQDIFLNYSLKDTVYAGKEIWNPEVLSLPLLQGSGSVKDLGSAMSQDPDLLVLVRNLADVSNSSDLYGSMDSLLAVWAGVDDIDPAAMRGAYSAQKLAILEQFAGRGFNGTTGPDPNVGAAPKLEIAYEELKNHVFTNFAVQTVFTEEFADAHYNVLLNTVLFHHDTENLSSYMAEVSSSLGGIINAATQEECVLLGKILQDFKAYQGITVESVLPHIDSSKRSIFKNLGTHITARRLSNAVALKEALFAARHRATARMTTP